MFWFRSKDRQISSDPMSESIFVMVVEMSKPSDGGVSGKDRKAIPGRVECTGILTTNIGTRGTFDRYGHHLPFGASAPFTGLSAKRCRPAVYGG